MNASVNYWNSMTPGAMTFGQQSQASGSNNQNVIQNNPIVQQQTQQQPSVMQTMMTQQQPQQPQMGLADIFKNIGSTGINTFNGKYYMREEGSTPWYSGSGAEGGGYELQRDPTKDTMWEYELTPEQAKLAASGGYLADIPYKKYDQQGNLLGEDKFSFRKDQWYDTLAPYLMTLGWGLGTQMTNPGWLNGAPQQPAQGSGVPQSDWFPGEGMQSGVPAWDQAATQAGLNLTTPPPPLPGSPGGATPTATPPVNPGGSPGMSEILKPISAAAPLLNQGGGSGGGKGGGLLDLLNGGNGNLGDILNLLGNVGMGLFDANKQGDAAKQMLDWLNNHETKMDNYMKPDSPEWNQMWEAMSRKDAAAGRNSQYGPRTADFLANVAKAKADNTRLFTTGNSRAYADALNQNASKYAGLGGLLGAGGGLGNLLNGLFGGGNKPNTSGLPSNVLNQISQAVGKGPAELTTQDIYRVLASDPGFSDYMDQPYTDPTEEDVLDFLSRNGWGNVGEGWPDMAIPEDLGQFF